MEILVKCWKCGEFKPAKDFHKDNGPRGKDRHGTQRRCKQCASELASANRKHKIERDPIAMQLDTWEKNLWNKFKITPKQWQEIFDKQNGVCAICGNGETTPVKWGQPEIRRLAVDHDRSCCPGDFTCGLCIRSLLCYTCNTFVGRLEKDKMRTIASLKYIGWSELS